MKRRRPRSTSRPAALALVAAVALACAHEPKTQPDAAPAPAPSVPEAPPPPTAFLPTPAPEPETPTLAETPASIAADRLAGFEVDTQGLRVESAQRWERYAAGVRERWAKWETKIGTPMAAWGPATLPMQPGETVFYPFSGPDFSTVHRLYPQADRYVLVAMQKAGPPLLPEQLSDKQLDEALDLLTLVFSNFTQKGFFITERMNARFGADEPVKGLTPILMAFAAREGFLVESVEPIWVAKSGRVEPDPGDPAKLRTWDSVRLNLRERSSGRAVTLDYVRMNLGDRRITQRREHMVWVEQVASQRVFVKAASHLMQQSNFAYIRDALLAHPQTLLQDESGIAYSRLERDYDVRLFGAFTKVNTLFYEDMQVSLAEAYATRGDVEALPFEIGYRKRAGSCLQLGTRKPAADATK